ncbi:MAG: hypothetical protein EA401_05345 [Planctomycetota bacterium]|nr:MAG: hypothetical protein EA401_05345 [Planctomycetota bacterium]
MIVLHRLNGDEFTVSAHAIESLEASPDTRITLINGKQLYVQEDVDMVRTAVLDWYRLVHRPDIYDRPVGGGV